MPSSQGHQNTQRRIFRGKGGATDGRLPPKKNHRVKVKYQPENSAEAKTLINESSEVLIPESDGGSDLEQDLDQLDSQDDDVIGEIKHLQRRLYNVQTSLQTSTGMSKPQIWYTNCLLPVKNAVKEWRSICTYHLLPEREGTCECIQHKDIISETSVQVFSLLQMAMQSGPLVGSNPGYFKRCGSEVASVALEFMYEIVDLTGVNKITENKTLEEAETTVANESGHNNNDSIKETVQNIASSFDEHVHLRNASVHSSDSSHSSISTSSCIDDEHFDRNDNELLSIDSKLLHSSQMQISQALQSKLLFSEKQSHRIFEWIKNAQKAVKANKAPSKSSEQLQSQKSKKQKMKDLKMERKLKNKKKSERS